MTHIVLIDYDARGWANKKDEKIRKEYDEIKHVVYGDFIDCNTKTDKIFYGKEYWMNLSETILRYLRHSEDKLDGDIGTLKTKKIVVYNIIHIGKESNKLDEDLGLDSDSYVIYENREEIERKFKDLIPRILELKPKDVKKFGISKQTLWNVKQKILQNFYNKISLRIKIILLNYLKNVT